MSKKYSHLHRYTRKKLGKNNYIVFKCNLAGCDHYVRKELAEGKIAECNRCGQPFILTKAAMQLAKPHCIKCVVPKDKETHDAIKEFLEQSETSTGTNGS